MSNKTVAIIIAGMIGVTFVGMGVWISSRSTPNNPPTVNKADSLHKTAETNLPVPEQAKPQPPKIPAFRVTTDKIAYDTVLRSQVAIAVFIEERVTEEGIRVLLDHLYALAKKVGPFKYREHPNYIDIRIYARKGQAHIAWGYESPSEQFNVRIRKQLLATVNDSPIVKLGLTESERQMIWRDIVREEDRAHRDAEEFYPFPMPKNDPSYTETGEINQLSKQLDYARELMKQYREELAESLGMTMEQLEKIGKEGMKNWWETPAIP